MRCLEYAGEQQGTCQLNRRRGYGVRCAVEIYREAALGEVAVSLFALQHIVLTPGRLSVAGAQFPAVLVVDRVDTFALAKLPGRELQVG